MAPYVAVKSTNGFGTLAGLDWVARCEITVQNEEEEGTYCVIESQVHTVSETYVRQSGRTYLEPHTDTKITIDTPDVGWLTDWTYSIYIKSTDDVTCDVCQGTGAIEGLITCPKCGGDGIYTSTSTCTNCHGTGSVIKEETITCETCNGSGGVTNWTAITAVVVIVAVVAVASLGIVAYRKKKHQP